jgi:hypothetical protein
MVVRFMGTALLLVFYQFSQKTWLVSSLLSETRYFCDLRATGGENVAPPAILPRAVVDSDLGPIAGPSRAL